jgi:hypothetical protein
MPPVLPDATSSDATCSKKTANINITVGPSHRTMRWTDRRTLTFEEFSAFLYNNGAPVGTKDGECFTPALFTGAARRMDHASQIDVAVLDSDCGHTLAQIELSVRAHGWRAIVHSTYSHMTSTSTVSADAAEAWLLDHAGSSIGDFMIARKGYVPAIMAGAKVVDDRINDNGKRDLIIAHAPCPKFRIVLPLITPWLAESYASQELANARWYDRICALAHALGLQHDRSCADTSRLFYIARTRHDGPQFEYNVIEGEDCPIWDLPDAPSGIPDCGPLFSPLTAAAAQILHFRGPVARAIDAPKKVWLDQQTGEVFDLNAWAAKYALRFEAMSALRARGTHRFGSRVTGAKHHIECPNDDSHMTSHGDTTGTFVVNASQAQHAGMPARQSGFILHCQHAGCKSSGFDRLDHIRALLDHGGLLLQDLTDPRFLIPETPIDISSFISKMEERPKSSEGKSAASDDDLLSERPSNVPKRLYENMPGALGQFYGWCLDTSHRRQPVLALGAALAFCSAVIGQRVKLQEWGTRPNIYILGVAPTGAGKDRPPTACDDVAREAGLYGELIGIKKPASDTAIENHVAVKPRQLMIIDEFHHLLHAMKSKNAATYLSGINTVLLEMYSASSKTYVGKSVADVEKQKTIDQPSVSLYGSCIPQELEEALSQKDIQGGILSRLQIFDAGSSYPDVVPPADVSAPTELLNWVRAWNAVSPRPNPMHYEDGEPRIQPRVVSMTTEAAALAKDWAKECDTVQRAAIRRNKDSLYVRGLENALKFALIRACASVSLVQSDFGVQINEVELRVDRDCVTWGIELERCMLARMEKVAENIADSDYEKLVKGVVKVIKRGKARGTTKAELMKTPAGTLEGFKLANVLTTLTDRQEVKYIQIPTKGRMRQAYVHRDFFTLHGISTEDPDAGEPEGEVMHG